MPTPRLLVAAVALAGCAAPGALDAPADHPAHPDAPTASLVLAAGALPAVAQPDLPAPLVPDSHPPTGGLAGHDAMGHGAMGHDATDHSAMGHEPMSHGAMGHSATSDAADPSPLGDALDAYLAVHSALAADRLDADAARAFAAAFDALAEAPPASDPHFWHMRADAVETVRQSAAALVAAGDLASARVAFGALGLPFADLVEAVGLPESAEVVRHTCGMADVAEGGVWLQRPGAVANPFVGDAMKMCGRPDAHEGPETHRGHEAHREHDAHGGHGATTDGADPSP